MRVVFLGDSHIHWFQQFCITGDTIAENDKLKTLGLPLLKATFMGKRGAIAPELEAQLGAVAACKPQIVVVQCGGNDFSIPGVSPQQVANCLIHLGDQLCSMIPGVKVILCQIPPRDVKKATHKKYKSWRVPLDFNSLRDQANSIVKNVAQARVPTSRNLIYWKHAGLSLQSKNFYTECLRPCGVHFSDEGLRKQWYSFHNLLSKFHQEGGSPDL